MPEFQPHELKLHQGTLAISAMPGRTRHYGTDWKRLLDWDPSDGGHHVRSGGT